MLNIHGLFNLYDIEHSYLELRYYFYFTLCKAYLKYIFNLIRITILIFLLVRLSNWILRSETTDLHGLNL